MMAPVQAPVPEMEPLFLRAPAPPVPPPYWSVLVRSSAELPMPCGTTRRRLLGHCVRGQCCPCCLGIEVCVVVAPTLFRVQLGHVPNPWRQSRRYPDCFAQRPWRRREPQPVHHAQWPALFGHAGATFRPDCNEKARPSRLWQWPVQSDPGPVPCAPTGMPPPQADAARARDATGLAKSATEVIQQGPGDLRFGADWQVAYPAPPKDPLAQRARRWRSPSRAQPLERPLWYERADFEFHEAQ